MILVLISPRHAGLPFAAWLAEARGELVAVATTAEVEGFTEVVRVPAWTDDVVLPAARELARRHRPTAVLALAETDVERAAVLRAELGLTGLDRTAAVAYRDKLVMKRYAAAGGLRVPVNAPAREVADVVAFMAEHPGRVVVKPLSASGSTGVHVLDHPGQAAGLAAELAGTDYEVEEFIDGALHHIDAVRVAGRPVAAVASRYADEGCLVHWTDSVFHSRNLDLDDPLHERLVAETWRLIDALPSPPDIFVHAEFFVTPAGEIVLCEVAARIGGGPIPEMLRQVLGIDPRELWARVECGLPVDLAAVTAHAGAAPRAAYCGIPPRLGRVAAVPAAPPGVHDFTLRTHVGDVWTPERYAARKCADFVASWVVTAPDQAGLDERLAHSADQVAAGFDWQRVPEPVG